MAPIGDDVAWAALESDLRARCALSDDTDWEDVSKALRALNSEVVHDVESREAQLAALEVTVRDGVVALPAETDRLQQRLQQAMSEIDGLRPGLHGSRKHFDHVMALVKPLLQEHAQLHARAEYYSVALEVDKRSEHARAQAVQATPEALVAFRELAEFAKVIAPEHATIKREALRRVESLSFGLKQFAVEKLQRLLKEVEWPTPVKQEDLSAKKEAFDEIASSFGYLLQLQLSQWDAEGNALGVDDSSTSDSSSKLWAMECVLDPVLVRFRYHFEREESPTNRLAKPEWFLTHIMEQTRAHTLFLERVLQPELQKHQQSASHGDAQALFLRGFIEAACKKLRTMIPALLKAKALLCHAVDEVLLFEQAVDDEFGYASWAGSETQSKFPRCIDVFSVDRDVLFTWTGMDAQYAAQMLLEHVLKDDAWHIADEPVSKWSTQVPPAARLFVSLLDFMCQRFAHMLNDEHRYLYVTQVHFALLQRFYVECGQQGREMSLRTVVSSGVWSPRWEQIFLVMNGAQYLVNVLTAWDQKEIFFSLAKRVTQSEKTRGQILKMHLQYSKAALGSVAKAATDAMLATEEAAAVRQAIAGPGALIGPTAAFSAAYSVGSKTVKSLFGRSESVEVSRENSPEESTESAAPESRERTRSSSVVDPVQQALDDKQVHEAQQQDDESLLFDRSIFERQISNFKLLVNALVKDSVDALIHCLKKDLEVYMASDFWTTTAKATVLSSSVSSALCRSFTVLQRVLTVAKYAVHPDCFTPLWKDLAVAVDGELFNCYNSRALQTPWTADACQQVQYDLTTLINIFASCSNKSPKAYLRKTSDVLRLLQLDSTKLSEVWKALDDGTPNDAGHRSGLTASTEQMEQLTTMLEACNIQTLKPSQVLTIAVARLNQE